MNKKIFKYLEQLKHGYLVVITPDKQTIRLGNEASELQAEVIVHDWRFLELCLAKGDIGLGEAYIEGLFSTNNIAKLLELLCLNSQELGPLFNSNPLYSILFKIKNRLKKNSIKGSQKNIEYHYDLGNDFYELWLDETMSYSSGIFYQEESLQESQYNKYQRIIDELNSQGGQTLEIGCGWSGFINQASQQDFVVKGLTLSHEQKRYSDRLIKDKKLNAEIALQDYRYETDKYDNIVSIEMFEAVGKKYWETYFAKIKQCLKKEGKAVIQTITISDDIYHQYLKSSDYIREYVFPGGLLPSETIFKRLAEKHQLNLVNEFSFSQSYYRTLLKWLDNFNHAHSQVMALGYSEEFVRKWRFYLAYCAAGFKIERTNVVQYSFTHSS